jgi:hypothetical protein
MSALFRPPQLQGRFTPRDPWSGYYNDLRIEVAPYPAPADGLARFEALTVDRERANPVTIVQLGLAAWQLIGVDDEWSRVVEVAARWVESERTTAGRILYGFPMAHTYHLDPPWCSAMAQGEAASLLVRASRTLDDEGLLKAAVDLVRPLVEADSDLVVETEAGPTLEEYPTTPPAHVLNGWIFALWGVYDVAIATGRSDLEAAFAGGAAAVAARLPRYRIGRHWSRYDLFPHPIPHVASPFYHRLHIEQLRALHSLAPHPEFLLTADDWERAFRNPVEIGVAVALKASFRVLRPRRRHPPAQ